MDVKRNEGATSHPEAVVRRNDAERWVRRLLMALTIFVVLGILGLDFRFESKHSSRSHDPEAWIVAHQADATTSGVVLVELKPEQQDQVQAWREEGIRMAAELTGLPEGFFRWLEDKGVPVAEFVHFLVPFLEFIDMMESRNSTHAPPAQKRQTPATI